MSQEKSTCKTEIMIMEHFKFKKCIFIEKYKIYFWTCWSYHNYKFKELLESCKNKPSLFKSIVQIPSIFMCKYNLEEDEDQ